MKFIVLPLIVFAAVCCYSQRTSVGGRSVSLARYEREYSDKITDFGVRGAVERLRHLPDIHYKYSWRDWHFIRCTPQFLGEMVDKGWISQVYFDPAAPHLLGDTMRAWTNSDAVHQGSSPLERSFTGKGVIIGYIDTGIDFQHDDFKHPDGKTRLLYYWDQSLPFDTQRTPAKYGYGQLWSSADMDDGTITSMDDNAHGTTVSGAGSGNGRANGRHRGVAPESDLIVVESDFSLANWTLTIADAVDFIFAMADELGKPAVVNTSLGTYLGSHDGTDLAAQLIDSLINAQAGRAVVAAAGNGGNQGKYHVRGTVTADTSFCWLIPNRIHSTLDTPFVYMDIWADTADFKQVAFAFGADQISPAFRFRGRTEFYTIQPLLNTIVTDSIVVEGNRLAPVTFSCELINGVYHIEALLEGIDSAAYRYRFETKGKGRYDLWSGSWLGASDIQSTNLPTRTTFPPIAHYHHPDTFMTTVSSWACSPHVATVGNFVNRKTYLDFLSAPYVGEATPGELSVNSSKGPNRRGVLKPEISAPGDLLLAACPLWLQASLQSSGSNSLAEGGQHMRNGGTSMAAPVVSGVAALYFEQCPQATHRHFLDDLTALANEDSQTGHTPNYGFGHGRVDAFQLLTHVHVSTQLVGDAIICQYPVEIATTSAGEYTYQWSTGATSPSIVLEKTDRVYVAVTNEKGCTAYSDTLSVIEGSPPEKPVIQPIGKGLITAPSDSIQWYADGVAIDNAQEHYYLPDQTVVLTAEAFGPYGCSRTSAPYAVNAAGTDTADAHLPVIFPNPSEGLVYIVRENTEAVRLTVHDSAGRQVSDQRVDEGTTFIKIDLTTLGGGSYLVALHYPDGTQTFQVVKK